MRKWPVTDHQWTLIAPLVWWDIRKTKIENWRSILSNAGLWHGAHSPRPIFTITPLIITICLPTMPYLYNMSANTSTRHVSNTIVIFESWSQINETWTQNDKHATGRYSTNSYEFDTSTTPPNSMQVLPNPWAWRKIMPCEECRGSWQDPKHNCSAPTSHPTANNLSPTFSTATAKLRI